VRIEPAALGPDVSLIGALPIVQERIGDPRYDGVASAAEGGRTARSTSSVSTRIGINGFGRIGRQTLKAILERHPTSSRWSPSTISPTTRPTPTCSSTTRRTAVRGRGPRRRERDHVDGHAVRSFSEKDPAALPWGDLGVDIVVESTGIFTDATKAKAHIDAGAKKVIISAPGKNEDITLVLGVNEDRVRPAQHHIVSNASCTTNGLALPAKVVFDSFGIERGLMTTIHSYTNDQNVLDVYHKDLRRARSAGQNIIPTTTGAARRSRSSSRAEGQVRRVRPPRTDPDGERHRLRRDHREARSPPRRPTRRCARPPRARWGLLGYTEEELVSMDFKGDERSSIVDAASTMVTGDRLVKVIAWYDNEWGYSCRVADLAKFMAERL
jgi:glyceraldehyde 3-phosphate dehydrogenase